MISSLSGFQPIAVSILLPRAQSILDRFQQPKEEELLALAETGCKLESLDLADYANITDRVIEKIGKIYQGLFSLSLASDYVTPKAIHQLLRNCSDIQFLNIENCRNISSNDLNTFADQFINVTRKPFDLKNVSWKFIKAVQNGPFGRPLLRYLGAQFSSTFSSCIVDKALEIATRQQDWESAAIITQLRKGISPSVVIDKETLIASTYRYGGFHPFETIDCKNRDRRWDLLMVVQRGGHQRPILISYLLNGFLKDFSYPLLKKALEITNGHNDKESASLIEQALSNISHQNFRDKVDMQILLAFDNAPNGYHSLGDLPKFKNWEILTKEELTQMAPDEDFTGEDVDLPDLNISSPVERALFQKLYWLIISEQTTIKFKGNQSFKSKLCEAIKLLFSTPSGRWLMLLTCRRGEDLLIEESHISSFNDQVISLSVMQDSNLAVDESGEIFLYSPGLDVNLFHELLHAMHEDEDSSFREDLIATSPWDVNYTDLEEQFTIAGFDMDCGDLAVKILSENMYRFERGYPRRYGHGSGLSLQKSQSYSHQNKKTHFDY